MFGSSVDENGVEIPTGSSKFPVITGERVAGNELISFDYAEDWETKEKITTRAELKFKQSNGAIASISYNNPTESWAAQAMSNALLHVFSKYMTKEEYYAALGNGGKAFDTFEAYVEAIRDKVVPIALATKKKLTLKLVYNIAKKTGKGYLGFPKFPDFAEVDGTTPSTIPKTNPKYDIYVVPVKSDMETASSEKKEDDMPF